MVLNYAASHVLPPHFHRQCSKSSNTSLKPQKQVSTWVVIPVRYNKVYRKTKIFFFLKLLDQFILLSNKEMWSAKTKPGLQKPFTSLQTTVTNKNLHASSFYPPHPLHTKTPNNKKPRTTVLTQGEWWTSFTNPQTLITNRIGGTGKEKSLLQQWLQYLNLDAANSRRQ